MSETQSAALTALQSQVAQNTSVEASAMTPTPAPAPSATAARAPGN